MEITLEEIQKKFEGLPENLKWAIMAANVDDSIIEICQARGLSVEQMGQLSLETHMEMFGFTPPEKFEKSVKDSLQLSDEKTKEIVEAINVRILKKIRTKMYEIQNKDTEIPETPIKIEPVISQTTLIPNTTEKEKIDNTQVLSTAGIEIIPDLPTAPKVQIVQEGKLELSGVHPMLAQKFSKTAQAPLVKTEHSLENITKIKNTDDIPVPPAPKSYPPKGDPYRLSPE